LRRKGGNRRRGRVGGPGTRKKSPKAGGERRLMIARKVLWGKARTRKCGLPKQHDSCP